MTVPAAAPGYDTGGAPLRHVRHPGGETPLGCPICGSRQHVVIDAPSTTHHLIEAYAIDGVSLPEYDVIETTVPSADEPIETITKVRCVSCRWAYAGPNPLSKLQASVE